MYREKELINTIDIAKMVEKKYGIPYEKVYHILNGSIKNIQRLVLEPDVFSIRIPYVGELHYYCNGYYRLKELKKKYGHNPDWVMKFPEYRNKEIELGDIKEPILRKEMEDLRKNGIIGEKDYTRHFQRKLTKLPGYSGKLTMDKIEDIQNEIYDRYKEKQKEQKING